MNQKPFKTHDELIEVLKSRGITMETSKDRGYAKTHLQRIGYYTLINGYSALFQIEKDKYIEGTTIQEIVALYLFDRRLRGILLQYILPFETNIKSLVAYYFPQHHPETNYLVYTNFDFDRKKANQNITKLLSDIQRQMAEKSSDPSIEHYLKNYGYVPLWVLNNILTLGTISKFYSLMKQEERQEIAKIFKLNDNEVESIISYISSVRNFCAHGNRLYCYRSNRPLCDTNLHKQLQLPQSEAGEYQYGKRDLFAVIIIFKLVLSHKDFKECIKQIDQSLNELYKQLNVIGEKDILKVLGFPDNWKQLLHTQAL